MFKRSSPPLPSLKPVVCLSANTTWYVLNFRSRLIETLIRDGWRVVVLSPPDRYVDRITDLGAEHVALPLHNSSVNPVRELATIWAAKDALRKIDPDLVLTFTPKINIYLSMAADSLDIPVIANISGLGRASSQGGWLERVTKLLYKRALSKASTVFFQNEEDRTAFVSEGLVNPASTRRLPGSGVDVDRFKPRAKPQPGAFRFLLVARLLWDKGVGEFVEAARRVRSLHPEVEFAVAGFTGGDNPAMVPQSQLDAWVQEGVITFLGSFDDMVPVYAQADCIVLPSYYKEGVPRTLLEAQSMGKPAITTDWPGCRDAVRDRITGYLVEPKSASALAERMLTLLSLDSSSVQTMSRAARDFACSVFDERSVLTAYQDAIARSLVWHPEHRAEDLEPSAAATPALSSSATAPSATPRSLESTASLVQ